MDELQDLERRIGKLEDVIIKLQRDVSLWANFRQEAMTSDKGEIEISRKRGKQFKPPSRQELQAFCQETGIALDVEDFMDYYEQCGWRWKAAARRASRTWAKSNQSVQREHSPLQRVCDHQGCNNARTVIRQNMGYCQAHRDDMYDGSTYGDNSHIT